MRKITSILILLMLCVGASWAGDTETIKLSTSVENPEFVYLMWNGNGRMMNSTSSPTETGTNAAQFAFFAGDGTVSAGETSYKILCVTTGKWLTYTKAASYENKVGFASFTDSKDDAQSWAGSINANGQDNGTKGIVNGKVYQFRPFNNTGVEAKYMNWYQGPTSNPSDGTTTVGLWQQDAAADCGSGWLLSLVPTSANYYLQEKNKLFVSLDDLVAEGKNSKSETKLASLIFSPKAFTVTVTSEGKWKISNESGAYLGQTPTTDRYWNSWVDAGQSDFQWIAEPVIENGELYYLLVNSNRQSENGKYLGPDTSADGEPLYVHKAKDDALRIKLLSAAEKLVGVTYNYQFNGATKHTETVFVYGGTEFAAPTFDFVTFTNPTGTVPAEGGTYDLECTTTPFESADSYSNIQKWYFLKFHANAQNYLYHDATKTYLDASKTLFYVDLNNLDAYSWAFVGNPFDGFSVVNKAAGSDKVLISDEPTSANEASTYPVMGDGSQVWNLTKSPQGTNGFYMALGSTGKRLNKRDSKVAYWLGGADAGSTFMVVEADESVIVDGKFNPMKALDPFDILEGSTVAVPSEFGTSLVPAELNTDIAAAKAVADNNDAKKEFLATESGQRLLSLLDKKNSYGPLATVQLTMKAEYGTLIMPCPSSTISGLKRKTLANTDIDANGVINLNGLAEGTFAQNTAYLIQAAVGSKFTIIGWDKGSKTTHTNGLLIGTLNETTKVPAGSYILSKHNDRLGFYLVGENADYTAAKNRCYLTLSEAGSRFGALYFDDVETGIENIDGTEGNIQGNGLIYNMAGQRMNGLQKGLNIVNGKIVIK